ncbi:DUF6471 domain-containing protein [Teredinibacter turnerae]|uniref:DUF6471 domain-containing protein n=1 Tax=Teredinibacter turnerae (strain ATCC 39867 / T7901) TaxID=377629 RepID=C5BI45_TERTT|nr:DUF6471 domain-containing protein [Teredinibacter turnerae]ACR11947.1 conserved hypothetical protein [Teredinibacter turnerae T7901]
MKQDTSVQNRQQLAPYRNAITRYLRSALKLKGYTYQDLSRALLEHGVEITEDNLRNKFSRGTLSADLLLLILRLLDVDDVAATAMLNIVDKQ